MWALLSILFFAASAGMGALGLNTVKKVINENKIHSYTTYDAYYTAGGMFFFAGSICLVVATVQIFRGQQS